MIFWQEKWSGLQIFAFVYVLVVVCASVQPTPHMVKMCDEVLDTAVYHKQPSSEKFAPTAEQTA